MRGQRATIRLGFRRISQAARIPRFSAVQLVLAIAPLGDGTIGDDHALGGRVRSRESLNMVDNQQRSNRGFASMDQNKQRDIARKGGESVPNEKRSFSRDPKLAAEAGRKGGRSVAPEARSFSRDPKLAAEAGRKGGEASHSRRSAGNPKH
jgi:general stress protein YciG